MIIIRKKNNSTVTSQSNTSTQASSISNTASPIIIGKATGGWLDNPAINAIDMNSYAKKAIINELKFKLRLLVPERLSKLNYFFTYRRNKLGIKEKQYMYISKSKETGYVKFSIKDLMMTGASHDEYKSFLEKMGAKEIKDARLILEKISL